MIRSRIAILGADISAFHLFNRLYRSDDRYDVVCFFELHQVDKYDTNKYLIFYPKILSGDLYQGINILHSFPYKQSYYESHMALDQVIFSPSSVYSPQYLYSAAEFIAMDASIVTHSLEKTRLPAPKALVSFFSSTQFDIPILLKMLQMYKDEGIKPLIAMQAPLYPFQSKDSSDVQFFFYLENLDNYEAKKYYFKNRHEIDTIKALLENGYKICFVYDFEKFSTEALRRVEFDMIVFVGLNSLPCFFESHRIVYACDDFTFGDEVTISPNFILCQQANIIIYAHLGPSDSCEKIKTKLNELDLKNLLDFVCLPVNFMSKDSSDYSGKTALLVDDSYPTHLCNSSESISRFLASSLKMIPFDLAQFEPKEIQDREDVHNNLFDKNWPAIILPETKTGVTFLSENKLPKFLKYDVIVSSTSNQCNLKPPSPIKVLQFDFEVNLDALKPEIFKLPPGALFK